MSLLEKVKNLREQARNLARSWAINKQLWTLADLKEDLEKVGETTKNLAKDLAKAEYSLNHLDPQHPDYETDKKQYEENIARLKEEIDVMKRVDETNREALNKSIKEQEQKIANIEAGKIKVARENIDKWLEILLSK